LRNLFSGVKLREVDSSALDFAGEVALSLFLAMALMSLRLWELLSLAGPMFVILIAQSVLMWIIVTRLTFPLMGSNYDAVLMAAGQTGFGLGGTATAMINMDALTKRYGWSARAFLFVPIVGSFMVSMFNAVIVSGFVQLLTYLQ
jgi:ESS family glutamate:Na+ symporter